MALAALFITKPLPIPVNDVTPVIVVPDGIPGPVTALPISAAVTVESTTKKPWVMNPASASLNPNRGNETLNVAGEPVVLAAPLTTKLAPGVTELMVRVRWAVVVPHPVPMGKTTVLPTSDAVIAVSDTVFEPLAALPVSVLAGFEIVKVRLPVLVAGELIVKPTPGTTDTIVLPPVSPV